jgi:hypothetical protein
MLIHPPDGAAATQVGLIAADAGRSAWAAWRPRRTAGAQATFLASTGTAAAHNPRNHDAADLGFPVGAPGRISNPRPAANPKIGELAGARQLPAEPGLWCD